MGNIFKAEMVRKCHKLQVKIPLIYGNRHQTLYNLYIIVQYYFMFIAQKYDSIRQI